MPSTGVINYVLCI